MKRRLRASAAGSALWLLVLPARAAPPEHARAAPEQHARAGEVASWGEALRRLRAHNPDVRRAAAALLRAEAAARASLVPLLPELGLELGVGYSPLRPVFRSIDRLAEHAWLDRASLVPSGGVTLGFSLSAAALSAHADARLAVRAEKEGIASARHALVEALAGALLSAVAADQLVARHRAGLTAAEERVRLTRRLAELGRASTLDVQRFAQDLHAARSALVAGEELAAEARDVLGLLLGASEPIGVARTLDPDALAASFSADEAAGCEPLGSLDARPERVEAHLRARLAGETVQTARLEYAPELRLASRYDATHAALSAITYAGERGLLHEWQLRAALSFTVFDGGRRRARVESARAEVVTTRARERALTLEVEARARRAERLAEVARTQLAIAEDDLAAAELSDVLSRRELELGKGTALEGVDAARRLRQAQLSVALRKVELALAVIRTKLWRSRCR